MEVSLRLDKAGRLVIPKSIRREMRLEAGDKLALERQGDQLILKPVRPTAGMKKEHGIWVFHSEQAQNVSVVELIEQDREKRIRELMR